MRRQFLYQSGIGMLVLCGLIFAQSYSFLLFHSLAEIFSIIIACGIFMLAWNTRGFAQNNYLLFAGIAYLFIGGLDLAHTLVYKGMGVLPAYGANSATQLWIAARYVESISLALAPWLLGRRLRAKTTFGVYALLFALLLAAVFSGRYFPDCFIEGSGLTVFKIVSEYVICLILLAALCFILLKRRHFDASVLRLLILSILLTIGSEIAFTLYISVYGVTNQIGHYLKIASFFLIYKALIQIGLVRPYDLLFRDLQRSRESLQLAHDQLEQRVQERTTELFAATENLKSEIIERERAQKELHKSNRMLKMLSASNQSLVRAKDEKRFLDILCQNIIQLGEYRFAWVALAGHNQRPFRPVAQAGLDAGYFEEIEISAIKTDSSADPISVVFRSGRHLIMADPPTDGDFSAWSQAAARRGCRSSILLPLIHNGDVLGVLAIFAVQPDAFDSHQVGWLTELAVDAAFGITTLRMQRRREAAETERLLLATAMEQAGECITIADSDARIKYINPAIERITGLKRQTYIGRPIAELLFESQPMAVDTILRSVKAGKTWNGQTKGKSKAGSALILNVALSPVKGSAGKIDHYVAIIRDITEQYQMAQQLIQSQKMEAIGTLAGGIAHDFNNILSAIIGFSELTIEAVDPGSWIQSNLQEVLQAGRRARELVSQILTFSRQRDQERKPISIKQVAKDALKLMRASLPSTIEIRDDLRSDRLVAADPTQIHQVIMNLCTNAGHAMQEKGGILTVELSDVDLDYDFTSRHPHLAPGPHLKLRVSDTGCGMSAQVMKRIFDPFFTTKANGEGTGMGLSVVHGIVKSNDGAITTSSEPGRGSTFTVLLPALDTQILPEKIAGELLTTGKERILFVDDEAPLAKLGSRMLGSLGYEVTIRTSSLEALELFRMRPDRFDLVVTDMTMPNMTGDKLAEEMMRIRADIPIILCTGFSAKINEEKAKAIGIREFVTKPVVKSDIAKKIRRALAPSPKPKGVG